MAWERRAWPGGMVAKSKTWLFVMALFGGQGLVGMPDPRQKSESGGCWAETLEKMKAKAQTS